MLTRVAGVLLAAGEGARFGRPKALVELYGVPLAERGVALLRDGGADPVYVVTGAAEISPAGAHVVFNPEWRTGMGSSVRVALSALQSLGDAGKSSDAGKSGDAGESGEAGKPGEPAIGAAVIALADQPLVGAAAVGRLIEAYRAGATVVVAAYAGRPRNPVLIAREHWASVSAAATGDTGARAFLRARPELVTLVECGDTGSPDDIDTPADLERIARQ